MVRVEKAQANKQQGNGEGHAVDDIQVDVVDALSMLGIVDTRETALRETLESLVAGYCLYKLTPAAARRWKCKYRVMIEAGYYDGQTAAEAYGRAVLALKTPAGSGSSAQQVP